MLWDTAQCAFWPLGLLNVTLPCREAKDGEATRRSYICRLRTDRTDRGEPFHGCLWGTPLHDFHFFLRGI